MRTLRLPSLKLRSYDTEKKRKILLPLFAAALKMLEKMLYYSYIYETYHNYRRRNECQNSNTSNR